MSNNALLQLAYSAEEIATIKREQFVLFQKLLTLLELEHSEARTRFGWFTTSHEGLAVLREEYIEVEYEIFKHMPDDGALYMECIQLATMALCIASECVPPGVQKRFASIMLENEIGAREVEKELEKEKK